MRILRIVQLALEGLRRTPLRVALTWLGVTIASGALVSMVAFALGIQRSAETPFRALGLVNHIQVKPEEKDEGKNPDAAVLDDDALRRIEALPGVVVAYPDFRVSDVKLTCGQQTKKVMALGLPRQISLFEMAQEADLVGDYFTPGEAPEAILSKRLAAELGFESPDDAVGAKVALEASGLSPEQEATFAFQRKRFTVTVVGIYSIPHPMPGPISRAVLLPVDLMKQIPGIRLAPALERLKAGGSATAAGYEKATVRVEHYRDLQRVEKAVKEMGFRTRTVLSRLDKMRAFFVFIDVLLAAVGTVALVVAGLGIINTLLMSVLERYQEIGIYKAIGASDGDLAVLFLTEAGVIGLLGGLGGLALGRSVSWLLEIGVNTYARSQGVATDLQVFAFPLWLLVAAVAFSAVISVLAGVYPAIRAARVDPIRALRRE
ncbi:MAG: ABC transporter permease [Pirellulales bacterium]|nr:ABC transporter permease [Pirellulales bacterium]